MKTIIRRQQVVDSVVEDLAPMPVVVFSVSAVRKAIQKRLTYYRREGYTVLCKGWDSARLIGDIRRKITKVRKLLEAAQADRERLSDRVLFTVRLSDEGYVRLNSDADLFSRYQKAVEANAVRRGSPERCGHVSELHTDQDNESVAALRELDPDLTTPEIQLSEAARDTLISSLESHVGTTPWMQFLLECLQGRTIICQLP